MHKLSSTPITLDCFEIDDYEEIEGEHGGSPAFIIRYCEDLRQKFLQTRDKKYWKELVRWLPEGWLQKRTVTMNYENIRNMVAQRQNHKLTEWKDSFLAWAINLPYAEELIFYNIPHT